VHRIFYMISSALWQELRTKSIESLCAAYLSERYF